MGVGVFSALSNQFLSARIAAISNRQRVGFEIASDVDKSKSKVANSHLLIQGVFAARWRHGRLQ